MGKKTCRKANNFLKEKIRQLKEKNKERVDNTEKTSGILNTLISNFNLNNKLREENGDEIKYLNLYIKVKSGRIKKLTTKIHFFLDEQLKEQKGVVIYFNYLINQLYDMLGELFPKKGENIHVR